MSLFDEDIVQRKPYLRLLAGRRMCAQQIEGPFEFKKGEREYESSLLGL